MSERIKAASIIWVVFPPPPHPLLFQLTIITSKPKTNINTITTLSGDILLSVTHKHSTMFSLIYLTLTLTYTRYLSLSQTHTLSLYTNSFAHPLSLIHSLNHSYTRFVSAVVNSSLSLTFPLAHVD